MGEGNNLFANPNVGRVSNPADVYQTPIINHFLRHKLLATLFDALETDGFPIGTGTHLQVQQLLSSLPEDTPPEDLKTLLAPLLTESPESQERFYELFDQSKKQTERMLSSLETMRGKPIEVKPSTWKNKYFPMAATALALLLGGLIWWGYFYEQKPIILSPPLDQQTPYSLVQVEMGDSVKILCLPDSLFQAKVLGMRNVCPEKAGRFIHLELDTTGINCLYYRPLEIGKDTLCLEFAFEQGVTDTTHFVFNVFEKTEDSYVDTLPLLAEKEVIFRDNKLLAMPAPSVWQERLVQYQWWIKTLAVLLLAYGLWMLVKWRQRKRQQYILDYQPNIKPPYVWNIALGNEPDIGMNEGFFKLLNLLRQRTTAEAWRLNMPKTVRATIKKKGQPAFVFDQQTQPPEYLVLIDQQTSRNHRARLFDFFYKKIKASDIFIERYFFDGDLRLCWNEQHPDGIFLKDLVHRYSTSRLLIGSTGYRLLSPRNGRLADWTKLLVAWRQRALVTSVPLADWGRKERTLDQLFHVVPSGTAGLFQAINRFETDEAPSEIAMPQAAPQTLYLEGDLMERLYFYFAQKDEVGIVKNDRFLQWIAACAVYPEIHWELTLQLARLLSTDDNDLCNILPLARICQLPWFTEGKMPEDVRQTLVQWLETQHPSTMMQVRSYLFDLLEKNPPPKDSAAFDQYRMNLCLNEWMLAKDKKRKKELENEVARRLEQGHEADFISLKKLEGEKGLLDQLIPESWKKALRPKDASKGKWSDLLWALPIWFFTSLGIMVLPLKLPECEGRIVEVDQGKWCIDTPEKELWVKEYYANDFLRKRQFSAVDSVLATLHPLVDDHNLDTVPMYKNLATICYNAGVRHFNLKQQTDLLVNLDPGQEPVNPLGPSDIERINGIMLTAAAKGLTDADSTIIKSLIDDGKEQAFFLYISEMLSDSLCFMFQQAKQYEAVLPNDVRDLDILSAPAEHCPEPEQTANQEAYPIPSPTSVTGRMTDKSERQNLPKVVVENKATGQKWTTGAAGTFKFDLTENELGKPIELAFSKDGYQTQRLSWLPEEYAQPLLVEMVKAIQGFELVFSIADAGTGKPIPFADVLLIWAAGGSEAAKFKADANGMVRMQGDDQFNRLRINVVMEKEGYNRYRTSLEELRKMGSSGNITVKMQPERLTDLPSSTSILFYDKDNESFRADARMALDQLRDILYKNPDWQLEITAHTDDAATAEYSQKLTDRIAINIVQYLSGQGIDKGRLISKSMGSGAPVVPNDSEADRAKNRRVELKLIKNDSGGKDLDRLLKELAADMVFVQGGTFQMGCNPKRDGECRDDELPLHNVTLSSYSIGKYEVTQELWEAVMGANPSYFKDCPKCPVETVSWNDIQDFLKKLNDKTGQQYRLPTEAEWEYAARGGNIKEQYEFSGGSDLDQVAWYSDNSNGKTHPVGEKDPNGLKLFDMSGNVWEWCSDWYGEKYYMQFEKVWAREPQRS